MAAARDRLGIVPDEGLDPQQALDLFTTGAARAIGEDASLAVGAPATFTILDVDPIEVTPDELRTARVVGTWVTGSAVAIPDGITTWQA
jgi:predicted amidohydrolase YtcJ